MMTFIWNLAAFIVALGILVTVHEFGHFWVARRCGIFVERFSVGFGKALWRRTDKHGTEFVLALIPLGGYVKMLDERVAPVAPELRHLAFNNKTIGQRAAVVSAGPIANFLLAIVAYWIVFMIGVPAVRPVVADIRPGSVAEQANILPGMELNSVDGIETPDWNSVRMAMVSKIGDDFTVWNVTPEPGSAPAEKRLDLTRWKFDPEKQDPILALGIMPVTAKAENLIKALTPGAPAEKAGLQPGDRIVKVSGEPVTTWQPFTLFVRNSPGKTLDLLIERGGEHIIVPLTPDVKSGTGSKQIGFAGVELNVIPLDPQYITEHQYGPVEAIAEATGKTWQLMQLTVKMTGKLITGDVKLNNLSGPVSIAKGAGISADSGLVYYLMFLALISVNLGIINLFPLPVLDGGHLLFLLIEKIKGGPVSERVQDFSYRIGVIALILLMGLALFNDFSRF
ncbi:sigma E protease regulator RseP [Morganella psychrotolerans]|uniref:sigma E protease regulator RseP n=1 Tax=Morganella psychrotolerans TaxID=368603 RepID=UPI0039AFF55A